MESIEQLGACGIVPVVVIENAANAVPAARALLAGGIDVMEITLRTAAAPDAIRAVANDVPEMLVGAGTVLNAEQARLAVCCGARFIVSPGLDAPLVAWCLANGVAVIPGCVTPSEIMAALALGLRVLKFFPADIYGGLSAMKALSGPFPDVTFIPTGGVSPANIGAFAAAPFIHAVGGSWVCAKADIAAGSFARITALAREAAEAFHVFRLAHSGADASAAPAGS